VDALGELRRMNKMSDSPNIAEVMPSGAAVRLDNERVRVVDLRMGPGAKAPMHAHPDLVLYVAGGGKDRWTLPDGAVTENEYHPGDVLFVKALSHEVENIGDTEIHLIVVELK
jgi:beta-alanine degradation protein BauB